MATCDIDVTVSVEAAIHRALRDFATGVLKEHGIRIRSIEVRWAETGTLAEPQRAVVDGVVVETQSAGLDGAATTAAGAGA